MATVRAFIVNMFFHKYFSMIRSIDKFNLFLDSVFYYNSCMFIGQKL